MEDKSSITSFRDLLVYQRTYAAMLRVMKEIIPGLPDNEKNDLQSQLSRSCKAIPRLIAEGYAKRHQKRGFQKYLDDAMAESNETVVSLSQCLDIYGKYIDNKVCQTLIKEYDIAGRQIYKLEESWTKFSGKNKLEEEESLT